MSGDDQVRVVPSTSDEGGAGVVKNVPGNSFDKHGSNNPIVSGLMRRFHSEVVGAVTSYHPRTILDVGCGEGRTTRLVNDATSAEMTGVDLEQQVLIEARQNTPSVRFMAASVYDLPFAAGSFDVVLATEMLEHLDTPDDALAEMKRVARLGVVVTVPHEPWWRIANIARGRYLGEWGNTPGHVQHWSPSAFKATLRPHSETSSVTRVGLWLLGSLKV